MSSFGALRQQAYDAVSRSQYYRDHLQGLTAQERHQQLVAAARSYQRQPQHPAGAQPQPQPPPPPRTDAEALRERHRFLRSADDDAEDVWEVRLARRYYARLFKEFAIADLSRYREAQVGLRWRTEAEVVAGKGQFVCGARGCPEHAGLASYEVNFAYEEAGQRKQALVKLRVCPACAAKLNHHKDRQHRKLARQRQQQEEEELARERKRLRRMQQQAAADADADADAGRRRQQPAAEAAAQRAAAAAAAGAAAAADGGSPAANDASEPPGGGRDLPGAASGPGAVVPPAAADGEARQRRQQQQRPPHQRLTDDDIERFLDDVFAE